MRWTFAFVVTAHVGTIFGIPAASAQGLLDRLERQLNEARAAQEAAGRDRSTDDVNPTPRRPAETTSRRPAVLGVTVGPVTEEATRRYGLAIREGALVTGVTPGSAAERAGLPVGAVIVAMDGRRVTSKGDVVQAVSLAQPGDRIEVTFYRGKRLYRQTVELDAGSSTRQPAAASTAPGTRRPPAEAPGGNPRPLPDSPVGGFGDRPLLGRIGRVIDELVTPTETAPPRRPTPRSATSTSTEDEVALLKLQVATMQKQIELLEQRLAEMERRLAGRRVRE